MDDQHEAHHREAPSTYRRRRIAAATAAAAVVVALALVIATRDDGGSDVDTSQAAETTTGTSPPPSSSADGSDPDGSTSTTSTTALVIPGFATPQAYLACVKERESRGDYSAVSPDGEFFGAYQIDQVTWNNTTEHAGLLHLYAIQPNLVAPADQDTLAMALLEWQGTTPWAGDC